MGLPLLRLPRLVITNIVDITETEDLACLSLCSKRARNILIVCRRQKRLEGKLIAATVVSDWITLDVAHCRIEVIQISNLESYMKSGYYNFDPLFSKRFAASVTDEIRELETVEIHGQRAPFFRGTRVLFTFWEDERIGLRKCMDFAREAFGIPVKLLDFSQEGMWAFDWINGWEEKIQQMTVRMDRNQDDKLKYVMEKCESRMLVTRGGCVFKRDDSDAGHHVEYYPPGSFHFDLHKLKTKCFFSFSAPWITLQNIATSFLEAVEIEGSSLTNRDLNLFLRLWLVGGFPCLRYIFIELCENILAVDAFASGVGKELRESSYKHKFFRKNYEDLPYMQYDLQQKENGRKMASIRFYVDFNRVLMKVW